MSARETLSSAGSPALAPLMEAWFAAFGAGRPAFRGDLREHRAQAAAMPALTLRRSDVAAMTRLPTATEKLSYGVALGEDGFGEPLMLRAGARQSYGGTRHWSTLTFRRGAA